MCSFYFIITRIIKPAQRLLAWTSKSLNGSPLELYWILSYPPQWNIIPGISAAQAKIIRLQDSLVEVFASPLQSASDRFGSELPGPDTASLQWYCIAANLRSFPARV